MTIPKRPSNVPAPPPSAPPSRPPSVAGASVRPPVNVRDAKMEAHAIAGGALARPSALPNATSTRKTVLLVDDDAAMRATLRRALETFYDVAEARDGMEAIELAPSLPNLGMVVSDVVMPRIDGFMLAKILRGHPLLKRVPIMFVSARNSPQEVTQAMALGACQYVPKTTAVPQIVEKIRKIAV